MKLVTMTSRRTTLAGLTAAFVPSQARSAAPIIGGSGSGLGLLRLLAVQHAREGGSDATVLPSLGSRGGLHARAAGRLDLAVVTSTVWPDLRALGFVSRKLAATAVAVVAHPAVPVRAVTAPEAGRMLAGHVATWPDRAPLRPILRERGESEWVALRGAIGVSTLGQIAAEEASVAILAVDGVRPEIGALSGGSWRAAIELRLARRAPAEGGVADFLAHLDAPQAAALLTSNGYLPRERPGT